MVDADSQHAQFLREALRGAPEHQVSAQVLWDWVEQALDAQRLFPNAETRPLRIPQLVVFTYLAAPRGASLATLAAAAEFLFVFFLLNDHWAESGAQLSGVRATKTPQVAYIEDWQARQRRDFGPRADRLLAAFAEYVEALRAEQRYRASPGHPTLAEYVDRRLGRYQWVGTAPYIELWELALGLELSEQQRAASEPFKRLSVELTYLANDLGSVARDGQQHNYVGLLQVSAAAASLEEAVELTGRLYCDKVAEFQGLARALPRSGSLGRYAAMSADIADGNLRATAALARQGSAGRYSPLLRARLNELPLIAPTP